jgi:hypothetical protein
MLQDTTWKHAECHHRVEPAIMSWISGGSRPNIQTQGQMNGPASSCGRLALKGWRIRNDVRCYAFLSLGHRSYLHVELAVLCISAQYQSGMSQSFVFIPSLLGSIQHSLCRSALNLRAGGPCPAFSRAGSPACLISKNSSHSKCRSLVIGT